jgi:Mrr restriction endonuclease-like protein
MPLTPHAQLQQWLVLVLGDASGSASRADALNRIENRFASALSDDDVEPVSSRPWEAKWRNRVSWQRDRMVKNGLLHPYAGPGTPWSLTEVGWALHQELVEESVPDDPLAHSKPKSSGEYRARLAAQVLTKQRSHEQLVADFGHWPMERGYTASTDVHPRDLVLVRGARSAGAWGRSRCPAAW